MVECLTDDAIAELVGSGVGARPEVRDHLDSCAPCRRLVASVALSSTAELSGTLHPAEVASLPLQRGAKVGRYEITRIAGVGAIGIVYAAYDPELDREAAIKLLRAESADPEHRARLQREARAMAKLSHPNVVSVYDVGVHGAQLFVAMELVDGDDLAAWLGARVRPQSEVLAKLVAAGEGLVAAHAAGIVHRDFKPENVMVDKSGRVRVTDFGLAGTPVYMAPEVLDGASPTPASDQFSFCVAAYEALYGVRPFTGETMAELAAHMRKRERVTPAERRAIPSRVRRAIARGLEPEPKARFGSVEELLAELRPRRRLLPLAIAAAALISALVIVIVVMRREPPAAWVPRIQPLPAFEENTSTHFLSPDGAWFVYASDRERPDHLRLYIERLDGTVAPRALAPPDLDLLATGWTGDGSAVYAVGWPSRRSYRVSLSGELTEIGFGEVHPCGRRVVVSRRGTLALRNHEGGDRPLALGVELAMPRDFECDAKGEHIVFSASEAARTRSAVGGTSDLWLMPVEGTPRRLTHDGLANGYPTFTPDGRSIVFSSRRRGKMNLWELSLASGAAHQLTFGEGDDLNPRITPDGTKLMFTIDQTAEPLAAHTLTPGPSRRITMRMENLSHPSVTPDGAEVIVTSHERGNQIVAISVTDGARRSIAPGDEALVTPDGSEIVIAVNSRLVAIPRAGGATRELATVDGGIDTLAIGDDRRVHFTLATARGAEAWSVPLAGGAPVRDVPATWRHVRPAPGGRWEARLRDIGGGALRYDVFAPGAATPAREITGHHLIWEHGGDSALVWKERTLTRVEIETGTETPLRDLMISSGTFALSPDGQTLYGTEPSARTTRHVITNFAKRPRPR